jgi:hypothetical protein
MRGRRETGAFGESEIRVGQGFCGIRQFRAKNTISKYLKVSGFRLA